MFCSKKSLMDVIFISFLSLSLTGLLFNNRSVHITLYEIILFVYIQRPNNDKYEDRRTTAH
jgi:hypothetical protein